jgi:hypothetical protein
LSAHKPWKAGDPLLRMPADIDLSLVPPDPACDHTLIEYVRRSVEQGRASLEAEMMQRRAARVLGPGVVLCGGHSDRSILLAPRRRGGAL